MKVNLKMIYTMDMEDSFIQMVTIILGTGLMERDLDTENLQISRVGFMKVNGNIANSWEINDIFAYIFSIFQNINLFKNKIL